uniref:FBD domain-containing protein n=1 Tax=Brassica campestris TaxID=3711 RepID=A0A3P5YMU3_BRACM|nr:unnamed protein product [Brassica rapa]
MDRISGLSDELLVKILLFVPTKVAVSTSILSKRWEYLWMWLPKLDYEDKAKIEHRSYSSELRTGKMNSRRSITTPRNQRLLLFLDRNLPLHRAPVIESFRLELYGSYLTPENVKMWVVIALSHCLRELDILYESYPPSKPIVLPSNLFTCKSLSVLKLDGDIILDVPRMVSLPSLKTLQLQSVTYSKDETLQRLLYNCPVLEDLMLHLRDYGDTMQKVTVVVPSLLSLLLCIPYGHDIQGFVIDTPNLKYFKLVDDNDKSHYCLIEHMPNLIEAHLDVSLTHIKSLIGSITSVKRLTICSRVIYFTFIFDEGFVFNRLEHLKVCICNDHSSNQLFRLLKSSSILQELNLFSMEDHEPQGMDDWNEPSTVPECLLSSLQTLSWSTYTGEPQERDIVVYILKHALHLKTARIKSYESANGFVSFSEMDRISGLSDELLVKILLFVPTKVAVSTSILSKRWEYLWMWLPRLEYGHKDCSEPESKRLQCFLDRNLPLHRAPVIESFHLELDNSVFKPENIKMCVVNAVYHSVRELEIVYESYSAKPNILPSNLYTCISLVILKLDGEILLDVPRMVSLPSLKTMKLQKVRYFNEEILQQLLSSCPVLEDLVVDLDEEDTTRKLTVVVPSLQSLSLVIPWSNDIYGFVMDTPALKYFKLVDDNQKSHYCLIEHMPNLIEAHLDIAFPDIKSLIGSITSVKRLSICSWVIYFTFIVLFM